MSCGRNRAVKSNPEISGCTRSNPEVSTIYAVTEFSTNRNAPLYAFRTVGEQERQPLFLHRGVADRRTRGGGGSI